MLYLLDANVLIDANRDYYPIGMVPEFWDWLEHQGSQNIIKMPAETYDEVRRGRDALADWVRRRNVVDALLLDEEVDARLVQRATYDGYADDLSDVEIETIGRDPFLVAYCLVDPANRCVVTTESSKPTTRRANRRLPDVCNSLRVQSIHTYRMVRDLRFSTAWRR